LVSCLGSPAQVVPPAELRVLTFNVKVDIEEDSSCPPWEQRKGFCSRVVRGAQADLIGFQETSPKQLAFFQAALPGYETVGALELSPEEQAYFIKLIPPLKEMGFTHYTDDILMFRSAAFEKVGEGHWWQSPTPDRVSTGFGNMFPRAAVWARLRHKASGREIVVAVTHFDNTSPAQEHMAELSHEKLQPFIDAALPVVFMGDFNSHAETVAYKELRSGNWRDAYTASPSASANGFDNSVPTVGSHARIDHIFYHGDALRAVDWQRLESPDPNAALSDHFPVRAVLELVSGGKTP